MKATRLSLYSLDTGWYTPRTWETYLPASMHASRTINPEWQNLKAGDRVDDYGFSADDFFIVEDVQPEKALIYKSERYGALFSWSLILHPQAEDQTLLHLRFRGKIAATGLKRRLIVWGGGWMDHISIRPVSLPLICKQDSLVAFKSTQGAVSLLY